jgi:hypothetical protein
MMAYIHESQIPGPMTDADDAPILTTEMFKQWLVEDELTRYHEAGHAVADYVYGFRPKRIIGALAEHDRRSTSFVRTRGGWLDTPLARQRLQDYAVSCIAGIAAESRISGTNLADLRKTSGLGDYKKVHAIVERLMLRGGYKLRPEVSDAYIRRWELRAVALMSQPSAWAAVRSVSEELQNCEGVLEREELIAAIERGFGRSEAFELRATTDGMDERSRSAYSDLPLSRSRNLRPITTRPGEDLLRSARTHRARPAGPPRSRRR